VEGAAFPSAPPSPPAAGVADGFGFGFGVGVLVAVGVTTGVGLAAVVEGLVRVMAAESGAGFSALPHAPDTARVPATTIVAMVRVGLMGVKVPRGAGVRGSDRRHRRRRVTRQHGLDA
jgi:hypothetical protein